MQAHDETSPPRAVRYPGTIPPCAGQWSQLHMIRQTEFLIITEWFSEQAPAFAANRPHSVGRSTN